MSGNAALLAVFAALPGAACSKPDAKEYEGVEYGGSFAIVEASMFDACVRAKHETAPARATS